MVMAAVVAIYGFVDLALLLATAWAERVKTLLHAVGVSRNWKHASSRERPTEGMCQLGQPAMRRTKINAKGQVTIPAELR